MVFVAGYAGEAVTERRAGLTFSPDRGMTESIVGRASYTIGPTRSVGLRDRDPAEPEWGIRPGGILTGPRPALAGHRPAGVLIGGEPGDFWGSTAATRTDRWCFDIVSRPFLKPLFTPFFSTLTTPSPLTGRGNNTYLPARRAGRRRADRCGCRRVRHLEQVDRELHGPKRQLASGAGDARATAITPPDRR
jgi:hypothetical protein